MPGKLHLSPMVLGAAAVGLLHQGPASAQTAAVTPADVAGQYFVAANGFETRVIHPVWIGDSLVVEDIRFMGNYPLITADIPPGALGAGLNHPATMVGGILAYAAPALFGGSQPQTVVFKRTSGPATGGVHAMVTFEGPPEASPSLIEALTRSEIEWKTGVKPRKAIPASSRAEPRRRRDCRPHAPAGALA
jgi:hypothetical protein